MELLLNLTLLALSVGGAIVTARTAPKEWRKPAVISFIVLGVGALAFTVITSVRGSPPTHASIALDHSTIQQNTTGDCSPAIVGSGNTTNCAPAPRLTASQQIRQQTNDPAMPWEVSFAVSTNVAVRTGTIKLKCDGPVLRAGTSRINPAQFITGSNGPNSSDPNEAVYDVGAETLEPGKSVTLSVYSNAPVTVVSGTIGTHPINF